MNESRVPKREWFGTGPKQHNCWKVIQATDGEVTEPCLTFTSPPELVPGCECCNPSPSLLVLASGSMPAVIELGGSHVVLPIDKTTGEPIGWSFLGEK